jgi:regulatory protein
MDENTLNKSALSKAMAICSRGEHCIDDIKNKFQLWGVVSSEAEKLIGILLRENFINEKRYAEAFVKDKYRYNRWGKVKIRSALRKKKIDSHLVNSALDSIDQDSYKDELRQIINSHRRHVKAKSPYELKSKLFRYGLSKGFESDLLYEILGEPGE